eukprot:m.33139 g.33139  ORF g.33139 m.33139 type:complete len:57 (+) comp42805_c0_seq1:59-229(+)
METNNACESTNNLAKKKTLRGQGRAPLAKLLVVPPALEYGFYEAMREQDLKRSFCG